MTMMRKVVRAQITPVGDDEVDVVISTAALARDGHILIPQGCRIDNYRANPIVLWQHNPDHPIGNAEDVSITPDKITARIRFAPVGISRKADEIRGLMKAGVVRAVSVGFDPIEMEPRDPKKPRGGQIISEWELLEFSGVSVGSDTGALVTQRSFGDIAMKDMKVGAARNLTVAHGVPWDIDASTAGVFAWAGGDDFDPAKVRQAFLVYDAENPLDPTAYALPIAGVIDGALAVSPTALRAAALRLGKIGLDADLKAQAEAILDHYLAALPPGERAAPKAKTRSKARVDKIVFTRGVYDIASLCYLFSSLGYQVDNAKWEAAIEGDGSKVPAMLTGVLHDLGDALVAMAQEEVAEALAGYDIDADPGDEDDAVLVVEERAHIAAGATPAVRAFRRGLAHAKLRAGKSLSAETVRCLREAKATHEEAMTLHRSAMKKHKEGVAAVDDLMDRAGVSDPDSDDTQTIQKSDGVDVDDGSRADADYRRRQAEALALATH